MDLKIRPFVPKYLKISSCIYNLKFVQLKLLFSINRTDFPKISYKPNYKFTFFFTQSQNPQNGPQNKIFRG